MKSNYLFLGGARDGEIISVKNGCVRIEVPVYIGTKVSPLDKAIKSDEKFPFEIYIKVNAKTDSGIKVVFVPVGTTVSELQLLIDRPIHAIIK